MNTKNEHFFRLFFFIKKFRATREFVCARVLNDDYWSPRVSMCVSGRVSVECCAAHQRDSAQ